MSVEPGLTLQWILWRWGDRHPGERLRFRSAAAEALYDIARCGTGALGWRELVCPEHGAELVPSQCRRRDCPQCVGDRSFKWACVIESRLLDCPHFHVVLTLSSVLSPYWRHNRVAMGDLLFRAGTAALSRLLKDPAHMGGVPAILAVLHTHGGALWLHPHLHVVVSQAGLAPDGTLVRAKRPMLLPFRALRRAFQMAFLHGLARLADDGDLHLPKGETFPAFRLLLSQLFAQPQSRWNVRIFRRDDVRPVVRYLSRTVYGGVLRNHRIRRVSADEATFVHQDWRGREEGDDSTAPLVDCTLRLDELVSRLSDHYHEPGFKAVRHYGLLAPSNVAALDAARAALSQPPLPPERDADDEPPEPLVLCPRCQRAMTSREVAPTQVELSLAARRLLRARDSPFLRWEMAA